MHFEVPQFIDIEDKIVGPLTIKQFIFIAGGAGICFAIYFFLKNFIFTLILGAPFIALSLALAFYKPGGRPFILVLESAFWFFLKNKLYIWRKEPKKIKKGEEKEIDVVAQINVPKLSDSKLSDLGWSLDIKDKLEDNINNN
ncbi:MAG: PrgI family protein [Candidatus Pacebacteria bacterium]|nr:PrgI family protein [Candidatus Paceibacterota bacterium]